MKFKDLDNFQKGDVADLIDSAFETFEDKSTEFILQVAADEVQDDLGCSSYEAHNIVMDYLYSKKGEDDATN